MFSLGNIVLFISVLLILYQIALSCFNLMVTGKGIFNFPKTRNSGTSLERPPLMSGLGGHLREVVVYEKFH